MHFTVSKRHSIHLVAAILLLIAGIALHIRSVREQAHAAFDIIESSTIDTQFPTRAKPNPEQNITDLNHWIKTVPYTQDQTAAGYVVYPKVGITIPLVRPNNDDLQKIQVGDLFNHYKYLEEGALHYLGAAPDQGIGNMVLAVHSSFAKTDPGRYKTVGQAAPMSVVGDKIFVYLANDQGLFTLYVYEIRRSEQIPETQVDILKQDVTQKSLTFFTCYPIGTTDARRVNQAVLVDTLEEQEFAGVGIKEHAAAEVIGTNTTAPSQKFITQSTSKTKTPETTPTKSVAKKPTKKQATKKPQAMTTQSVASGMTISGTTISGSNQSNTVDSSKTIAQSGVTPTFLERVTYRPVAYYTTIKLVSMIGFKRSNLQRLVDAIDTKVAKLAPVGSELSAKNRKTAVIFLMIKELIEGFMG